MTRSFTYFLKDRDPPLYDEYVMERYKEGLTGKGTVTPEPKFTFSKPKFRKKDICDELAKISELNTSHRAKKYLVNRGITEDTLSKFYYCPNFKKWTNKHKKIFDTTDNDDDRIIIPLRDIEGTLFGYQGRSLDPTSKMRYITVMLDEDAPKLYGLENINTQKPIYILEGPFDSLFVENSIAMCGSDIDIRTFGWSDYIWVYDNEPRSRQITDKISKSIDAGDSVVIWPKTIRLKDLNDMHNSGIKVKDVVQSNVYRGLEAKLQLSNWKI